MSNINLKVSIDKLDVAFNFTTYPNPVSSLISIETRGSMQQNAEVKIYSLSNILIVSKNIHVLQNHATLNLERLSSGVYIMEISSSDGKAFQKIVLE